MGAHLTIQAALGTLDPENDDLWTAEGLPRMDVIEKLVGGTAPTRKQITEADPEFSRDTAKVRNVTTAQEQLDAEIKRLEEQERKDHEDTPEKERETKAQISPEEELAATIVALGAEIDEMTSNRSVIDKLLDQMKKQMSNLQAKALIGNTPKADTIARMLHIKSQNELRVARHAKGRSIMALIGKDGMNPKSRLDQAYSRKTQRGTKRPKPRTPRQ